MTKVLTFALLALVILPVIAADSPVYDIPKLADVKIDGKSDDWAENGFKIDALSDVAGRARGTQDFSTAIRIGWNDAGLLVLLNVLDDVALEPAEKPEDLWQGDSIEFFVCMARGSDQSYQVVVAPGRDAKKPELRSNISDYRKGTAKKEKLAVEAARTVNDKGYLLEVLLPWKNLGIEAKEGGEVAFQIYTNDADKENERFQALWFPKPDAHSDTNNTQRLKLAAKASPSVRAAATGNYDNDGKAAVTLNAAESFNGKTVFLKEGEKVVAEGKFESNAGRAVAKFTLPKTEKPYPALTATVDGEPICVVLIPEATK